MALIPDVHLEETVPKDEKFYFDFVKNELKGLNTATFRSVKAQVLSILLSDPGSPDGRIPVPVKLLCGEWLFKKIYMFFRLRGEELEKTAKSLVNPIQLDQNIVTKSGYLQYRDLEATNIIALEFYLQSFVPGTIDDFFILQLLNDTHLLRNYSGELVRDKQVKRKLIGIYSSLDSGPGAYEKKSNILDVLLRHFPRSKSVKKISDELSFGASGSNPTSTDGKISNRSVFGNAQSVHDREVENEALRVAAELLEYTDQKRKDLEYYLGRDQTISVWVCDTLKDYLCGVAQNNTTEAFLTRIKIDNTPYSWTSDGTGSETINFTIFDLLAGLMIFLASDDSDKPIRETFAPILFGEMDEAKMLCTTGFVARIMSSLQGCTPKFQMKMSETKRLVGLLSHRVCTILAAEGQSESVILGSYDPDYRADYLNFVCGVAQKIWREGGWEGKNPSDMVRALEIFSGIEKIWSVSDDKIFFMSK